MQYHWRAIVKVTGIPTVTQEEMEKITSIIPGSVQHESGRRQGTLFLKWQFVTESPNIMTAAGGVMATWRSAIEGIEGARPTCEDFRVFRVKGTR